MNIEEILKKKELSPMSILTYTSKLKILNDNKEIINLNFLFNIKRIKNKLKGYKLNSQRTFIIAITSVLKSYLNENPNDIKLKNKYEEYYKILIKFNNYLRDQSSMSYNENSNWISNDEINEVFMELKRNKNKSPEDHRNYLILALYHLLPPRRNKDYQYLKIWNSYDDIDDINENYIDIINKKLIFNFYKTSRTYEKQLIDIPMKLYEIIMIYINKYKLKHNDYLINNIINKKKPLMNINAITVILNKIFKKNIGVSMLRKVYLTSKYSQQKNEMKSDVRMMGTSLNTANNNYIKNKE